MLSPKIRNCAFSWFREGKNMIPFHTSSFIPPWLHLKLLVILVWTPFLWTFLRCSVVISYEIILNPRRKEQPESQERKSVQNDQKMDSVFSAGFLVLPFWKDIIHMLKSWHIKAETQAVKVTWTTMKQFLGRHKYNCPSKKEESPFRKNACWCSSRKLPPQLHYSSGDMLAPVRTVRHQFSSCESHKNDYFFHCVSNGTPVQSWAAMLGRDESLLWYAAAALRLGGVQGT